MLESVNTECVCGHIRMYHARRDGRIVCDTRNCECTDFHPAVEDSPAEESQQREGGTFESSRA